ncbi:uncharacterized protein LOC129352662 isoform X1 [Poeciliopsis prolifica]|uniref:uncharacterized protein LOC129352662 isoform X1 n=1 Tax=Poeciliopsis prolifica TaxID=188132 RepID=UPI002413EA89|nr:uncharacterized protein LOC129352662 isoform X1 [Poeciliopsis prolifica]
MLTAPEFTLTGPRPGSQTDLNFIGPHQSFIAHSLLPKRTGLSRQTDWTKSGLKGTGLPKSLSLYLQLRPIQNQEVDHRKEGGADSYSGKCLYGKTSLRLPTTNKHLLKSDGVTPFFQNVKNGGSGAPCLLQRFLYCSATTGEEGNRVFKGFGSQSKTQQLKTNVGILITNRTAFTGLSDAKTTLDSVPQISIYSRFIKSITLKHPMLTSDQVRVILATWWSVYTLIATSKTPRSFPVNSVC